MRRLIPIIFLWAAYSSALQSQSLPDEAKTGLLLGMSYGFGIPGGDLADRYGNHFMAGLNPEFIFGKRYWIIGIEGGGFFGQNVKEDVVANLKNSDGDILGSNRALASFYMKERGFQGNLYFGKIFPLGKKEGLHGIKITAGAGFMRHRIKILDEFTSLIQVANEYGDGYDRLSSGFMLHQSIGYQRLDILKRLNFFASVDLYQGFTKSRRSFNYSTMQAETAPRIDLMTGLRVGFILPFYFQQNTKEIYY